MRQARKCVVLFAFANILGIGLFQIQGCSEDDLRTDSSGTQQVQQLIQLSCTDTAVLCVPQEYSTIQAAANVASAGQTVLIADGTYTGFQITRSGTSSAPISYIAAGNQAIISTPISGQSTKCNGDGICFKGNSSLQGVSDIIIDGFTIKNVYRCVSAHDSSPIVNSSTQWPHKRITLRNNHCSYASHEGFYMSEFYNSLIESNEIHHTGRNGLDKGHCMYLANAASDYTTIQDNLLYECGTAAGSAGIHFNGDRSVGGDGFQSGLLIQRNVIHHTRQNGMNMDGVGDSTIQNNLIYAVSRHGMIDYSMDSSAGPKNLKIINNTFLAYRTNLSPAIKLTQDQGGHTIFNNIRIQDGTATGDPSGAYDVVANYATGLSWFTDPTNGIYRLKSGSVPVDSGRISLWTVAAPPSDLEGRARPSGASYDLGALEYGTASPPTPVPTQTPTPAPAPTRTPTPAPVPTRTPTPSSRNQLPTATLSASATSGYAPLSVTFTATASDPEGDPLTYAWNFGDSSYKTSYAKLVESHSFSFKGQFVTCFYARDLISGNSSVCATITVY
jgi:hypothetical protein